MKSNKTINVEKSIDENGEIILSSEFGSIISYANSEEAALKIFIEDIKIYVEDYCNNVESMSSSKNRANDLDLILELKKCTRDAEIEEFLKLEKEQI
ncbi:MAG: hypothetical protein ACRC3Y_00165 [Romboutsia sp.]|uniref:hypothetical protein n=1 Tax=Romboutsia sp. TaxID=1965302 RepID=UPI003F3FCF95